MRKSDRLTALATALVVVLLLPVAALATPDRQTVCHRTSNAAPDGHGWVLLEVSSKSLEGHLRHGDVAPGETLPGGAGVRLDETCAPEVGPPSPPATEPPPSPEPPPADEIVFAVAYSDVDQSSDVYNPDVDILIAKLVDGPDGAADGVVGPGDKIVTAQYPTDFGPSDFGDFVVTEHIVTTINAWSEYSCNVSSDDAMFVWSSGLGAFDLYQEWRGSDPWTRLLDKRSAASTSADAIEVNSISPSEPVDDGLALTGSNDPVDHTFIDVEAACSS